MPVTCTEIFVRLRRPPDIFDSQALEQNHFRMRISPDVETGFGMMVLAPDKEMAGRPIELIAGRHPDANEMDAYERVLSDALAGDTTLFAREDYVEEAWRIVDPVLGAGTPVYDYEPGTWGPLQAYQAILPPGGWHAPALSATLRNANQKAA